MLPTPSETADLDALLASYGLTPLTLEHRGYFRQVLANLLQPTSDYAFANIFPYADAYKISWQTIHRHLCIFMCEDDLMHMILPPLPEGDATTDDLRNALLFCCQRMYQHNSLQGSPLAGLIHTISTEMMQRIEQCGIDILEAAPAYVSGDYIYDMQKMISLSGNGLASRRYAKNKFMREYPTFRLAAMTLGAIPACLELLDLWHGSKKGKAEDRAEELQEKICCQREKTACEIVLTHWQALDLKGMLLFIDEQLVGFTFGEALTPTQASIIIEKTHPAFDGASALIFSEFCRQYWNAYKECNASDDGNAPSLRFTKEQYRPTHLLPKFVMKQARPG